MTAAIDIVEFDVMVALKAFIESILPSSTPVIRGQVNRTAMPKNGFVVMTPSGQERLSTNVHTYDTDEQTKSIEVPTKFTIQLDFYGELSQTWSQLIQVVFRDSFAIENMPKNIVPLYADNPIQMPLINGEEQYEQRWTVSAVLQYNPIITLSQQSALTLTVGIKEVDTTFKP